MDPVNAIHPSQLRRLAHEYASGNVGDDDYRRRRRSLIDGIVDGDILIERTAPPVVPPPPRERAVRIAVDESRRISPLFVGLGALVVALVVWALFPRSAPDPEPAPVQPPQTRRPAPASTGSEARTLVERFLVERDWGEASVGAFSRDWRSLDVEQRREARSAPWFRRLIKAMRDGLKTQSALAEFDTTGTARATGRRIVALGELLGVGDGLPRFDSGPDRAPAPAGEAKTPAPAPASAPAPARVTTAAPAPVSGSRWLSLQSPDAYTLQLFALDHLDRVESLMARHPELEFRVISLAGETPRYRVFYGAFASAGQARAAHARLPADVAGEPRDPLVKRFAEIAGGARRGRAPGTELEWLAAQGRDRYTLQVFASDNLGSVQRLVAAYPDLTLKLLHTDDGRSLYRVLYGVYSSEDEARRATGAVPRAILGDAGTPLVKSVAELQDIARP